MSGSAHQHVGDTMRKHYDLSKEKRKRLAGELGIPDQTLIDLYLRDCASSRKRLAVTWRPSSGQGAA